MLGCAQTGTGKTAAFALPILQRLICVDRRVNGRGRKIRALALAPTRSWRCKSAKVSALMAAMRACGKPRFTAAWASPRKSGALNMGVDVLIATPGRLLDLMQQGYVDLSHVETLILDEADRMLDMGFIHDLQRIVQKVPRRRQTLLFSATLPPAIRTLAEQWLTDPAEVRVTPAKVAVEAIRQSVFFVDQKQKLQLLTHWLRKTPWTRTLVFTRTKHGADKVAKSLLKAGIPADAFHGNKSQSARQRALLAFQVAKAFGPRGDGHCRTRAGHRHDLARGQLRFAGRRGELCPSHRPHRSGRRRRGGRFVLRSGRAGDPAGHSMSDAAEARRGGASGGHGPNRVAASEAFRREDQQRSGGSPGVHEKSPSKAARQPSSRGLRRAEVSVEAACPFSTRGWETRRPAIAVRLVRKRTHCEPPEDILNQEFGET